MPTLTTSKWRVFVAAVVFAFSPLAVAQRDEPPRPDDPKPPSLDDLTLMVGKTLPSIIGSNNSELVDQLMKARLGTPLSKAFDPAKALSDPKLFPARPTPSPDCRQLSTPSGDPDLGECTHARGAAGGRGTYRALSFSKHMGLGNIKYFNRPADADLTPEGLQPVKMTDEEAYKKAVALLVETFGLPEVEIPAPPAGAKNPYPVQSLHLGWGEQPMRGLVANKGSVPVRKVVFLQRGLLVGLKGASGTPDLPWVQGPGRAIVVLDDAGVRQAMIGGWQELLPHPAVDPKNAKSREELVLEIAEDLQRMLRAPVESMKATIQLRGVPQGTIGLLLPAVQISVSPLPGDLFEEKQGNLYTSAGFVREYPLVKLMVDKQSDD
jgi:hypothetical protein